jgi:hypothetical protein
MKEKTHKHKGVLDNKDNLRWHPISRVHRDADVQKEHDKEVGFISKGKSKDMKVGFTPIVKGESKEKINVSFTKSVMCPVDNDGFIYVDLTQRDLTQNGVRIKVMRREYGKTRTAGIEITK